MAQTSAENCRFFEIQKNVQYFYGVEIGEITGSQLLLMELNIQHIEGEVYRLFDKYKMVLKLETLYFPPLQHQYRNLQPQ